MRPRLTIITPSFNQAAFLERTLRSVLDQGYEDLEYLVVDGGSADGSVEILERYDERLSWWVSEPDRGQTDALNKALRRATGDVIAYINSDDVYLPGAFDRAIAALESAPEADWMVGACRFKGDAGFTTEVWRPEMPKGARYWWILGPWGVPQPSSFWRRRVFDDLGVFREDLHYVFDTEHALRLAIAGRLPVISDDELAVRVLHDEAKSAGDDAGWAAERERLIELYAPLLTERERRMLTVQRALISIGFYRATQVVHPVTGRLRRGLTKAGAILARR
jgi:glycosyltransferase involved in cell wall biosynthesis